MLKRFLELGIRGTTYTKEVMNEMELISYNIPRPADYWAVYELEVREADGMLFMSSNKRYLSSRIFRKEFRKISTEEFVKQYPRQTAIISVLKSEGVKAVWIKQDINILVIYAAKENDESEH